MIAQAAATSAALMPGRFFLGVGDDRARVVAERGPERELGQELPLPRHFEQRAENVTEDEIADVIVCGPDVDRYLEKIAEFEDAGFDHVYIHQVGPDQESFFQFAERELLVKV